MEDSMNKRKSRLATICSVICMAFAILCSPATALTTQAAVSQESEIMPMKDVISWVTKVENGKVYKRLYNFSTATWLSDWIYVRDEP